MAKKGNYHKAPIMVEEIKRIRNNVLNKDRDFVLVIDGEEGSGKSVLAQQIADQLDEKFTIENIVFNADQFIERLKKAPKHSCIVLDEAYNSANSRSALTEVNKSLVNTLFLIRFISSTIIGAL